MATCPTSPSSVYTSTTFADGACAVRGCLLTSVRLPAAPLLLLPLPLPASLAPPLLSGCCGATP